MKSIFLASIFLFTIHYQTQTRADIFDELNKYYSPKIENDTLYIKGRLDSHIYDYIMREYQRVKKVQYVSLHSLGGNHEWTLEVAKKIKELHLTTLLKSDHLCASACIYLFAAGQHRVMDSDTWLGFHGVRLSGSYSSTFRGLCFIELESGETRYIENLKGCKPFVDHWYELSLKATEDVFDFMISNGITPDFKSFYMSLDDDPRWYDQLNVIKKPDLIIRKEMALQYHIATAIRKPD